MAMTKVYTCNICGEKKNVDELIGLRFGSPDRFTFSAARAIDGVHICTSCLSQIEEELQKKENNG